jgi:hypothetical protein
MLENSAGCFASLPAPKSFDDAPVLRDDLAEAAWAITEAYAKGIDEAQSSS